jgi:hypothetical protein
VNDVKQIIHGNPRHAWLAAQISAARAELMGDYGVSVQQHDNGWNVLAGFEVVESHVYVNDHE